MSDSLKKKAPVAKKRTTHKPMAKAEKAAKTNTTPGSLVKCEVKIETGEWVSPDSCATYKIDADGKFPEITYEIKTEAEAPYEWSWELTWEARACPQRRDKARFKPKHKKTFSEKGKFTTQSKQWKADLNGKVIGGQLTVKVKVNGSTFVRRTIINGTEPGEERILNELSLYKLTCAREVELAKKIFKQETRFCHFFSDDQPLVSFDNGYGLGQATSPVPSYEEVWNWKAHVKYIVMTVIKEKRASSKRYLDHHGNYADEDWDMEALAYYNGANYNYFVWNSSEKRWQVNPDVLCDPDQSNAGWDISSTGNKNLTLAQLRAGEGEKPIYTGRCYAEHVKNNQR
jgi:hypothetical protein